MMGIRGWAFEQILDCSITYGRLGMSFESSWGKRRKKNLIYEFPAMCWKPGDVARVEFADGTCRAYRNGELVT